MRNVAALIAVASFAVTGVARGADVSHSVLMESANQAFQKGEYAEAAKQYQQLVELGALTPDVYFNLGTAELKAGRRGAAILAFERTLRIDPRDGDATFNLAEAEKGNIDKIVGAREEPPILERLGQHIPAESLVIAFLIAWLVANAALMARWFSRRGTGPLGLIGGTALFFSLALAPVVFLGAWERNESPFAVVVSPATSVREGPAGDFKSAFEIHEGLKVRVVRHERGFLRIRLPNGIEGWVNEHDVPVI